MEHPIFSTFEVRSAIGLTYNVEVRMLAERQYSYECVDFRINSLGTCKHVEGTLLYLEARHRRLFREAGKSGSTRIDIVPDLAADTLRIAPSGAQLPRRLRFLFGADGRLRADEPA